MAEIGRFIYDEITGVIKSLDNNIISLYPACESACEWSNWTGYTLFLSGHAGVTLEYFNGKWYVPRTLMPGPISEGQEQIKTTNDITNSSSWTVAHYSNSNSLLFTPREGASNSNGIIFIGGNTNSSGDYWNILVSQDGDTWSGITYKITGETNTTLPMHCCAGSDKFLMNSYIDGSGKYYVHYSTDMINWNQCYYSTSAIYDVKRVGNYYYILFELNAAKYSSDGITWNDTVINGSFNQQSIAYLDGKYVATDIHFTGKVATSNDGINFTTGTTTPNTHEFGEIYSTDCMYLCYRYGPSSSIYRSTSDDGINWTDEGLTDWWIGFEYANRIAAYYGANNANIYYKTKL